MKKKKQTPKQNMPEFEFKQFTPEESEIYDEAIARFRLALDSGKSLREAYDSYQIEDETLRNLIRADFLKIVIAERHFGKGQTLQDLAAALTVPVDLIQGTKSRMLQEAGITAASQFGQEFGDLEKTTDD